MEPNLFCTGMSRIGGPPGGAPPYFDDGNDVAKLDISEVYRHRSRRYLRHFDGQYDGRDVRCSVEQYDDGRDGFTNSGTITIFVLMNVWINRKRDWTKSGPEQVFLTGANCFYPGGFIKDSNVVMHFAGIECPDANFCIPDNAVADWHYVYPGDTVIYWKDSISYWNEVNTESDGISLCNEMRFLLDLEKI